MVAFNYFFDLIPSVMVAENCHRLYVIAFLHVQITQGISSNLIYNETNISNQVADELLVVNHRETSEVGEPLL